MTVRVLLLLASPAAFVGAAKTSSAAVAKYEAFRTQYGETRENDQVSREERMSFFEARSREIAEHNARPDKSYTMALNRFTDASPDELSWMLGYKSPLKAKEVSSFLQATPMKNAVNHDQITAVRNWADEAASIYDHVLDQGSCGSCWAVAAVGLIEATLAIQGHPYKPVSFEEVVACSENPRQCGGKGGCDGATSEIAFDYLVKYGMAFKEDYPEGYLTAGNKAACHSGRKSIGADGLVTVPANDYQALMDALTNHPVVVSVDAEHLFGYGSGLFDECKRDSVPNHAMLALGYGYDKELSKPYWFIRNSWGKNWGENGYIRILRDADKRDPYCGWDYKTQEGTACIDDPKVAWVCGHCGILYDSVYPVNVRLVEPAAAAA